MNIHVGKIYSMVLDVVSKALQNSGNYVIFCKDKKYMDHINKLIAMICKNKNIKYSAYLNVTNNIILIDNSKIHLISGIYDNEILNIRDFIEIMRCNIFNGIYVYNEISKHELFNIYVDSDMKFNNYDYSIYSYD